MAKKKSAAKKKTVAKQQDASLESKPQPSTPNTNVTSTQPAAPVKPNAAKAVPAAKMYPGRVFGSPAFRSVPPCIDPAILAPLFTKDGRFVISPGPSLTVSVWNYPEGTLDRSLAGPATRYDKASAIKGLALSPDETKIAASGFGPEGMTVRVFSFDDGSEICYFDAFCDQLLWLPDSQNLLYIDTRSSMPGVKVFHLPSATSTGALQMPMDWTLVGVFLDSADGLVVFYRKPGKKDAKLAKYRIIDGQLSQKPTVSITVPSGGWYEAAFAFAPTTGKAAIAQGGDPVSIYDLTSKRLEAVLTHSGMSDGVSFDPAGKRLAMKERIRKPQEGNRPHERLVVQSLTNEKDTVVVPDVFRGSMAMSWGPDGEGLATWSAHGLETWNSRSGEPRDASGHRGEVTSIVATGPKSFASAGADGTVRMWNSDGDREQWIRYWPEAAHRGARSCALLDESVIVGMVTGPSEAFVRASRVDNGEEIATVCGDGVYVDSDRHCLWVSSNQFKGDSGWTRGMESFTYALKPSPKPQRISLDDVLLQLGFKKNEGWVPRVSLEHGGRWLVVHNDKQLVVADWPDLTEVYRVMPKTGISMAVVVPSGAFLLVADNPGGAVSVVAMPSKTVSATIERRSASRFEMGDLLTVSPDSTLCAWCKRSQRVEVYEVETGKLIGATPEWLPATTACFIDASTLLVGSRDGMISSWPLRELTTALDRPKPE